MSLINDALKKAQRLRAEQSPDAPPPPVPGGTAPGHRIAKRGQAMPAQTLILIIGAAAVLVVLSAVITVILLNRTPEPAHKPAVAAHPAAHPAATGESSPVIVAPVIAAPKPAPEPPPAASTSPSAKPAEISAEKPAPAAESVPVGAPNATATTPPLPAAPVRTAQEIAEEIRAKEIPAQPIEPPKPAPARPNPQVQIFVDSIRVAGIRFSGNESKVLMNDRVYRVNDVVDRNLGIRLKEVTAETLTFVDANGVTYVKNF
ncbi:MAG: hypothetical protein JSS11_02910 [Verrucomicrobia bacterium]|nr:hypothetical protein [Verrucomicrobiota bacterium]